MSPTGPALRRIFLHFFDLHFLELKGVYDEARPIRRHIESECKLATRFALLAADEVFLPAASFFESELCYRVIDELSDLYPFGVIYLVGGGVNIQEYIEDKLRQYSSTSIQSQRYQTLRRKLHSHPPFLSRRSSASKDITTGWLQVLTSGDLGRITEGSSLVLPKGFEDRWLRVPERLDGRAFIVEHVEHLLLDSPRPSTVRNRLHSIINEQYFASFTRELCSGVLTDLVYLGAPHAVPSYDRDLPYRHVLDEMRRKNLLKKIECAKGYELQQMKADPQVQECLAVAISEHKRKMDVTDAYRLEPMNSKLASATIGIITALPEEFAAACDVLGCGEPIDAPGIGAGRKYAIAEVKTQTGAKHTVVVGFLIDMGNNQAAIRAAQMTFHCKNIKHIIMTGIAGAVPNPSKPADHVRLGDIVVSDRNGVIQYDLDKESPAEIEHRHPPRPPAAVLLEADRLLSVNELRGSTPWNGYIDACISRLGMAWQRPGEEMDKLKDWQDGSAPVSHPPDPDRRQGKPRVFHGPIASANKLLKNPTKRDALRDKFRVKAVEMEGAGIADATWETERGYMVIRGTCDYCNSDKGDVWHKYAAVIAASYTRALIEVLST